MDARLARQILVRVWVRVSTMVRTNNITMVSQKRTDGTTVLFHLVGTMVLEYLVPWYAIPFFWYHYLKNVYVLEYVHVYVRVLQYHYHWYLTAGTSAGTHKTVNLGMVHASMDVRTMVRIVHTYSRDITFLSTRVVRTYVRAHVHTCAYTFTYVHL